MPSRKKSYRKRGSRKGAKAGKAPKRRSLRFTPKFVIKERADTIEESLNETMGRTSYRIPGDIANIIQGYEGGDYLYFVVDPKLDRFTYSSTTAFKNGEKIVVDYESSDNPPYIHFLNVQMIFRISNQIGYRTKDLCLVVRTNIEDDVTEDEELLTYILRKHYGPFIENMRKKFGNNAIIHAHPEKIKIEIDYTFSAPSHEEVKPTIGDYEIVFEKSIPTAFGL